MDEAAGDPAALELLRVQRGRLADRLRLPWWYQAGAALVWAVVFAGPFTSRYLPRGMPTWPVFAAAAALACLLQWCLTRVTGIRLPFRNLRSPSPGRPVGIAILVIFLAVGETELLLIGGGLIAAAVAAAAVGVAAELACLQIALRVNRRELRGGGPA